MSVRDVRIWTCDVTECDVTAERVIRGNRHEGDETHDLPLGWVSLSVHAIRGHHNVGKWLCPHHADEHVMPMFPEYAKAGKFTDAIDAQVHTEGSTT